MLKWKWLNILFIGRVMRRNRVNKIGWFCLFAISVALNSLGQSTHFEFDHYTTKDGLSNGYISSILQDSEGFIWIGTGNGLNRFDGISFKNYYFNAKDTTSIPGSVVNAIIEDSLGNIWVVTTNGLCLYDRKKDHFSRKRIRVKGQEINNLFLFACFIDSKGFFWFNSPGNGIYRFNLNNNPQIFNSVIDAELFLLNEEDASPAYKYYINSYIEDENNQIWVASSSNQLFYFDRLHNQFVSQTINHPEVNHFSNKSKLLIKDNKGDFYLSIEDAGLLVWERKKNQFKLYKPNGTDTGPKGDVLDAIAEDKDGLVWIGDRNSEGINIFNKKTRKFIYCQSQESNPYSLNTNKINCIYRDKTGSMWVGGIIGVNKYSPDKIKFKRYFSIPNLPGKLSNNNTLSFAESKMGEIWIGTDGGGLNKMDRKTGEFLHFEDNQSDDNSLSSNTITSICEDHEGTLWMGTYHGGLARMKNGKFHAFYPDPTNPHSLSDRNVWYVFEDSKQNLWAGTLSNGLELFDRKTNNFHHFKPRFGDSTSLSNNYITEIYEDSKQNLYIIGNNGVSILDLKAYDFSKMTPDIKFKNLLHIENKNSLISNNVYCAMEDNEGDLWFGTVGAGIDKLDHTTGKFTNYSTIDGLPGNSITSILEDSLHHLWLATDKGLAKFNPKTKEVVVFEPKDGLQNMSLKSWAIQTKNGEMFFGGPDGFNSFYPDRIKSTQNQNIPPIVITELRIFNSPVKIGERINKRILLPDAITGTKELVLTHSENFFTFEFIALDYTTPEKNKYAYMMEGFDKDWVQCGSKREANYTNLDAGEYTFRVKASNNDGVWNEKGTSIKVIILPQWWATWWFRIMIGLIVAIILTSIYYLRISQFKNQKILLEKLVAQKTYELQNMNSMLVKQAEELNQTNSLLEVRQGQIEEQSEELFVQKESLLKMNDELHNLNATKDKFFSIIAHDIKNPFNAILGFTSLLEANFTEWTDEMKLEIINMIHSSSKNLYQLLENLLQWSRSQRGIIEFKPERIELKVLLHSVIDLMKGTADAKNIELTVILPKNELTINADQQMLDTILRNLIGNALKFTNRGGKVQVKVEAIVGFVMIKITDNGVGMQSALLQNLFRIDANFTTPGTNNEIGTGLGLILVKEFVEKHGGEIRVESIVGQGSVFYFTLPLAGEKVPKVLKVNLSV